MYTTNPNINEKRHLIQVICNEKWSLKLRQKVKTYERNDEFKDFQMMYLYQTTIQLFVSLSSLDKCHQFSTQTLLFSSTAMQYNTIPILLPLMPVEVGFHFMSRMIQFFPVCVWASQSLETSFAIIEASLMWQIQEQGGSCVTGWGECFVYGMGH